jgi:hypothetical protein
MSDGYLVSGGALHTSCCMFVRKEVTSTDSKWLMYRLVDRGVWVRIPVMIFSFLNVVQTGSLAHTTTYPVDIGGSFPGGKAAGSWSWPFTFDCWWAQEIEFYRSTLHRKMVQCSISSVKRRDWPYLTNTVHIYSKSAGWNFLRFRNILTRLFWNSVIKCTSV